MKKVTLTAMGVLLVLAMGSCKGGKAESENVKDTTKVEVDTVVAEEAAVDTEAQDIEFIQNFYDKVVFALSEIGLTEADRKAIDEQLVASISPEVEKNLKSKYGYYKVSEFRTNYEDGPEDESKVKDIVSEGDGWYLVSYSDMGNPGKTRIHIMDGKIVFYERVK